MKRTSRVALGSLSIGAVLFAALVPAAGAYLAPVSISPNVQVDTRDPAQPLFDYRSPVVAINPTDSSNVVIASRHDQPDYFCHVHYSLDGGATWRASTGTGPTFPDPPVPVGKDTGTCWSPGAAFDAAGNVYVVAQDRPGVPFAGGPAGGSPTTVIVWKSTDGGRTFGVPVTIPASTTFGIRSFSVQADIAVDTTPSSPHFGRIYVTWHEFPMGQNIYAQLVHSDDGGQTWSDATNQKLPGPMGKREQIPELAIAPDGTVYDIFKAQSPNGSPGTDCMPIGFGPVPPGGSDCPIMILRSSNGGASFDGDPFTVGVTHHTDTAVAEEPSVVVTPSGTVLVAAATIPNPPPAGCAASLQAVAYRSTNRGQTWSAPQQLNDDPCATGNSHRDPRLSVAPNGRIDAGFYDSRLDPSHQKFDYEYTNSTDDGATFGPNARVSDASFDGMLLFTPITTGFQTRDYDTVTGLASTNTGAIAAWGDTRNDPAATDVWSSRISFLAAAAPPGSTAGNGIPGASSTPGILPFPVVSNYGMTNTRFAVGAAETPVFGFAAKRRPVGKHKRGSAFKYTLSEAASVTIVITQRSSGRRQGKRCVGQSRKLRRTKRCTRTTVKGTLRRVSRRGANRIAFSGRIGSRALRPGRYQATLTATDSARRTSKPKTVSFTILKR